MKRKNGLITIFVAVCSLFLNVAATVNKGSNGHDTKFTSSPDTVVVLESLLPKNILGLKAQMTTNYASSMTKIFLLDPGLKSRVKTATSFDASFFDAKLLTQAGKRTVEVISFDQLITTVAAAADDKVATKSLLVAYREGIATATGIDGLNSLMCNLIKSAAFKNLSSTDKDYFYKTFLANKVAWEYGKKIGFLDSKGQPVAFASFDSNLASKSFASLNARPYGFFGCWFLAWAGQVKPKVAYRVCDQAK